VRNKKIGTIKDAEKLFGFIPKKIIAVYHGADMDGFVSGLVIKKYYEFLSKNVPDLKFIPIPFNYEKDGIYLKQQDGSKINILVDGIITEDTAVIFGDISPFQYPGTAHAIWENAGVMIVNDHHAEAILKKEVFEKTHPNIRGISRIDKSGCQLCWEFFFGPFLREPLALTIVGNWDRFVRDAPMPFDEIRRYNEGFKSIRGLNTRNLYSINDYEESLFTGTTFDRGSEKTERKALEPILRDGSAIVDSIVNRNMKVFENHEVVELIIGKDILIPNVCVAYDSVNNSFLFEDSLGGHENYLKAFNAYIIFRSNASGKAIITLFTPEGSSLNAGALCTKLGGGGHKNVGGAVVIWTYCVEPNKFFTKAFFKYKYGINKFPILKLEAAK
jgi:hypothetical protein